MQTRTGPVWLALAALLVGLAFQAQEVARATENARSDEFVLSGPFTSQNLSVFLIHGPDRFRPARLLTLEEALEQNKAIVHETGSVEELQVENVSADVEVFIQSGDIVKGGKQDRLISFDLLLPPGSGKVPVASLCVEQGRWQQRGKETASKFSSSASQLPSRALKLQGGNYGQFGQLGGQFGLQGSRPSGQLGGPPGGQFGNLGGQFGISGGQSGQFGQLGGQFGMQGGVWTEVSQLQQKLKARIGVEVNSNESRSSLQLTLEHPRVRAAISKYNQDLARLPARQKDVIGYAFAINGKINSIEVYGTAELFAKLWPKLLRSNALEALLAREKGKSFPAVPVRAVTAAMRESERGKAIEKDVSKRVRVIMRETDRMLLFETRDQERNTWLHRSYLTK